MFINKEEIKTLSLREELNREIKAIAREKLSRKNLDTVTRQILEEIVADNKPDTKAA